MKTIGLTGGIGSGKSTVASVLKHMGYPVYIADREAARLMDRHPGIRRELTDLFGPGVYTPEGRIDRKGLAAVIFHDRQKLTAVNRTVHPRVMEDFMAWSRKTGARLVFFESAILFEAGLEGYFTHTVCVTAPEGERLERVRARDGSSEEEVRARIGSQMDEGLKCGRADFTINNGRKDMVIPQVLDILQRLEKDSRQDTEDTGYGKMG